jgi:hypothetical protein
MPSSSFGRNSLSAAPARPIDRAGLWCALRRVALARVRRFALQMPSAPARRCCVSPTEQLGHDLGELTRPGAHQQVAPGARG